MEKTKVRISVQRQDFEVAAEYATLREDAPEAGAIATFVGLVRDLNLDKKVTGLVLEHYPGMTEKVLAETVNKASRRWPLIGVRLVHRVGELKPGEQIVFVGVSSEHRDAAFEACEYLMDILKTSAPFWKKEQGESGSHWLEEKTEDLDRAKRWHN